MKIVIAGGTGFLGAPLADALRRDRHSVLILTRNGRRSSRDSSHLETVTWTPDGTAGAWAAALDDADAVINLSGESIAGRRWTRAQKARIRDSRLRATRSLASAIAAATRPPALFLSGSAVGIYGDQGEAVVTEDTPPGRGFLSDVARAWEAEAEPAARAGTRVALLRTGVVLDRNGGALPEMARPIRFFAGGPIGSGRQYLPWIHRDDWVGLVRWLLGRGDAAGPFNATAPTPATNEDFTRALARALRRPAFLRAPAFALKLALGEMAGPLLLTSQRVVPARALAMGFTFRYPTLDEALGEIYR
jgi:uncharacterized protein